MTETMEDLAARIKAFVTGRGHDWNLVAAAYLAADSHLILWKIGQYVDEDGWIEWVRVADAVDRSGWSSGEMALIRLACSLAREFPPDPSTGWTLGAMLAPLDAANSRLAVEAVRYAAMGPA